LELLSGEVVIERPEFELMRLKRMQFGRSSEAPDAKIGQLQLTLEEFEACQTQLETSKPSLPADLVECERPVRK
jgi:hypothetical protein